MKKLVLAAAVAIATAMTASAFAAPPAAKTTKPAAHSTAKAPAMEETTSGAVASYSAKTRELKLNTGVEFKLAPTITNAAFKAGDKVKVQWKLHDGKRIADQVTMSN